MGDSNRVQVTYWEEATWGTGPTTEAMTEVRMTGESLNYNITNAQSTEIRDDRQITDVIQVGAEATGGINLELSYGSYDDFLASALFSTWSADLSIEATTISTDSSELTSSSTAFENVVAGQWIKISGMSAGTNNTYWLVTAITSTGDVVTVEGTFTTEATGATVTVTGSTLSNGVTEKSFTIERFHAGLSAAVYFEYTGMVVSQMNLNIAANQIITGNFDFLGKSGSVSATTTSSGGITAANTNDIINATSNVGSILEADVTTNTTLIQSIGVSLNNNLRGLDEVGTLGNANIGTGVTDVTGTLSAYFQNKNLIDKYIAGTKTSLSTRLTDNDGNTYIFTFHKIAFETAPVNAGSSNSDVMQNLTWRAMRHPTYDNTIQIDRFAA